MPTGLLCHGQSVAGPTMVEAERTTSGLYLNISTLVCACACPGVQVEAKGQVVGVGFSPFTQGPGG